MQLPTSPLCASVSSDFMALYKCCYYYYYYYYYCDCKLKVSWSLAGCWRHICFADDCSAWWLVFWATYNSTSNVYTRVKPTIFAWILTIKLSVLAYMWVVPHSHTLTARVSITWTISQSLGLHVWVAVWAVRPHTDCCHCSCIPVKSAIVI